MNLKNNMDEPSDRNLCCDILRSDFRNAMLLHDNTRPWHYGVDLSNKDDPNSLSQYLKLTNKQYEDLLVISGLGRKVKYTIGGIEQQRKDYQMGVRKKTLIIERVVSTQP